MEKNRIIQSFQYEHERIYRKAMDKLKEWFEKDCGKMDENRSPYDFYVQGYNRAKIEELECRIKELEAEVQRERIKVWVNPRAF